MLRLTLALCGLAVLAACSGPEIQGLRVDAARDYASRQVGDRVPSVKLRSDYLRQDTHISGDKPFPCNGQQYKDTQIFLRILSTQGNRLQATWTEVDSCGEVREYTEEGRFDDQFIYIYNPTASVTFMNRLRIVDGGAQLLNDRYYQLEDGKFTEKVYEERVDGGGDADSFRFGPWKATLPVPDRRAAVQVIANNYRAQAANGREELRREQVQAQRERDRYAPVPMPSMAKPSYSPPARPAATVKSSSSSGSTSATSSSTSNSAGRVTATSATRADSAPAPSASTTAIKPVSTTTATSPSTGGSSGSTTANANASATSKNSNANANGNKSGGALIIDTKAADQRKAFEAQEAARARQAAAAKAEQAAAADALRAKMDAQSKADQERALAEMKARGNKQ